MEDISPIIPDGSWCGGWDLWGLSDPAQCPILTVQENPLYIRPTKLAEMIRERSPIKTSFTLRGFSTHDVRKGREMPGRFLLDLGMTLSDNGKTRISWNHSIAGSCWPTPLCFRYCYGQAVTLSGGLIMESIYEAMKHALKQHGGLGRIADLSVELPEDIHKTFTVRKKRKNKKTGEVEEYDHENVAILSQLRNLAALRRLARADQRAVDTVADAIVAIVLQAAQDNLRWCGVGDLNLGAVRVISAIGRRHPGFRVWGFTRIPKMALQLPRLENVTFHLSTDESTSGERLEQNLAAAKHLGTALAFTSLYGDRYMTGAGTRAHRPSDASSWDIVRDTFRGAEHDKALDRVYQKSAVVFGLHNATFTTHVGVPNECPATDSLGPFRMAQSCQQCQWCISRHAPGATLEAHRARNTPQWLREQAFVEAHGTPQRVITDPRAIR